MSRTIFHDGTDKLIHRKGAYYWITPKYSPERVKVTQVSSLTGNILLDGTHIYYHERKDTCLRGYNIYLGWEYIDHSWCIHYSDLKIQYHRLKSGLSYNHPSYRYRDLMYQPSKVAKNIVFIDGEAYKIESTNGCYTYLVNTLTSLLVLSSKIIHTDTASVASVKDVKVIPTRSVPLYLDSYDDYTLIQHDDGYIETRIRGRLLRVYTKDVPNMDAHIRSLYKQSIDLTSTDVYLPLKMPDMKNRVWISDMAYPITDVGYYIYRSRKVMIPDERVYCAEIDLIMVG